MIVLMGQAQSRTESATGVIKVMIEKQIKGYPMEKTGNSPEKEVSIDLERALTSEEARKRIGEYGYNEVPGKKVDGRSVWPREGHYALDPKAIATYPPADLTIERIGDLVNYGLPAFLGAFKADHAQ